MEIWLFHCDRDEDERCSVCLGQLTHMEGRKHSSTRNWGSWGTERDRCIIVEFHFLMEFATFFADRLGRKRLQDIGCIALGDSRRRLMVRVLCEIAKARRRADPDMAEQPAAGGRSSKASVREAYLCRLSSAYGRAAPVKLATRLIVEDALVAESRDYYAHGASAGQVWRVGVRMGRLKTAEGFVDTGRPASANGTR